MHAAYFAAPLPRRLLAYLLLTHAATLGVAIFALRDRPALLIGIEIAVVLSLLVGVSIWRKQFTNQRILRDGTAALRDQDYSLRLREVGVADLDELIEVYNRLLEQIRTERLDNQRRQFFLTLLIESTTLGVFTMDYDGGLDHVNSWGRKQLDLPPAGPLPQNLRDVNHPLAQALSTLGPEDRQLLRLLNNQRFRCEAASFIDRGFSRRFIVVQNISGELNSAEVNAYGQVIRMMAHEVNNATAATRSMLVSLLDTDDLDAAAFRVLAKAYLPTVLERGNATNDFMRRFADVVRLPEPALQPVDLAALLASEAEVHRVACADSGVEIQLSLKPATVRADPVLLRQVVTNALVNARESIESTERAGHIAVSCEGKTFGIADDGAGIDAETQRLLFTPFFSTKATGQGIGLTLMRDVLERHGAQYSLTTEDDGWTRLRVEMRA